MANRIRLRRGLEANVPTTGLSGEVFQALDTGRQFYADGSAVAPVKVHSADVIGTNAPNGLVKLDAGGKIPSALLPDDATVQVYTVATIADRDALSVQSGDKAQVTDNGTWYVYDGTAWLEFPAAGAVTSVNGQTGAVNLELDDIADVDTSGAINGSVLRYDGTTWTAATASGTFIGLTDTPATYTGEELRLVRVNAAGTELEFTDEIDGGTF